ncbi:MAG TPA: type II toxin-antitoxin system Phd/YefM family antitoxin [Kiritimatiellia bacterium]|nr:type II toxin-antitoxin system Phd/YefM family antitoxin [Kiritimatiellia bacterium]
MKTTYSIKEAQTQLPRMVREAAVQPITIMRRDEVAGFLVSPQRMEGMMETLELLADPRAMKELKRARRGRGRYHALSALDEG